MVSIDSIFIARRYLSAVYAVVVCLCVDVGQDVGVGVGVVECRLNRTDKRDKKS